MLCSRHFTLSKSWSFCWISIIISTSQARKLRLQRIRSSFSYTLHPIVLKITAACCSIIWSSPCLNSSLIFPKSQRCSKDSLCLCKSVFANYLCSTIKIFSSGKKKKVEQEPWLSCVDPAFFHCCLSPAVNLCHLLLRNKRKSSLELDAFKNFQLWDRVRWWGINLAFSGMLSDVAYCH